MVLLGKSIERALIEGMQAGNLYLDSSQKITASGIDGLKDLPTAVLAQDLEGRINYCNTMACIRFGYSTNEFIGLSSVKLVPKNLHRARAEAFKRIIETGTPKEFKDSPRIKKGGETIKITGYAFRYHLNGKPSIGAIVYPS